MRWTVSFCLLFWSTQAWAIDITVAARGGDQPALVMVSGALVAGDGDLFKEKIGLLPDAIIAFSSDGGDVVAGIQIGETIRLRSFYTVVPGNSRCASACALAWLGGAKRFMSANARIGFHAAYNADSGRETGVGNALVGAYLTRIGLPYSAVVYITQAAPTSMTWLTLDDARQYGIPVSLLDAPASTPSNSDAAGSTERRKAVGDFVVRLQGEWSQGEVSWASLEQRYADQVLFYGKLLTREAVIADKRKFVERWPFRKYHIRPGTLTVSCDEGRPACRAEAIIDWQVANSARQSSRTGTATASYLIASSGGMLVITEENGSVVSRGIQSGVR